MLLVEPIRNGKYIDDGAYWLAIQVWAMTNLKLDDVLVFPSICQPHVQIGYFQNAEVEVNHEYLKKNNLYIVRRNTGGGAIYIDKNAFNICYLIPYNQDNNLLGNYQKFYQPIIDILKDLGASEITQSGKNDLTIDSKKVSGAAMMLHDNYIYGGYSLLYKVDYEAMEQSIKPNRKKIISHGVSSVRQRVGEIYKHLDKQYQNYTVHEFKDLIIKKLFKEENLDNIPKYVLSEEQWLQIDELVNTKYKNWDWTYGMNPLYEYNRDMRIEGIGTINFSLVVDESKIKKIKISGDFFNKGNIEELENNLIGTKMILEDLIIALKKNNFSNYFFKEINEEQVAKRILDINE